MHQETFSLLILCRIALHLDDLDFGRERIHQLLHGQKIQLTKISETEEQQEQWQNEDPHALEVMLEVGVAHGRMIDQRKHQVPEPNIFQHGMTAAKDILEQKIAKRKAHHRGRHRRKRMLYRHHKPRAARAVADVPYAPSVVFEHADFVDFGPRNHGKAQVRHFVHERTRECQEIHEEIGKVAVRRPDNFYLGAFQTIQEKPRNHGRHDNDQRQDNADGSNGSDTVTPTEPRNYLGHRGD